MSSSHTHNCRENSECESCNKIKANPYKEYLIAERSHLKPAHKAFKSSLGVATDCHGNWGQELGMFFSGGS